MNILLIEDNIDHSELISEMLYSAYKSNTHIKTVSRLKDGLEHLKSHAVDLMLCDLKLPDSGIEDTVEKLTSLKDAPAIIVLTSLNDENLAHQLVKEGIQDYLPKNELNGSHLARACNYAIERRALSASLINKNEDYRAFCYSLTHDFKSSLWQIQKFAEIFIKETQKKLPDDEGIPFHYIEKIFGKLKGIHRLVDDLQDYLSLDVAQLHLETFPLSVPIINAIESLAEQVEAKNAKVFYDNLPEISANQSHLQLLFTNLISNAIKYNNNETPSVWIECSERKDFTVIYLKDNGIGIPEDKLETIFIPFERIHSDDQYSGTGLGLSIVKRIIQHHQGRMQITSEVGEGTTFTLLFPKVVPGD